LHCHTNTIRYRFRRIETLTGRCRRRPRVDTIEWWASATVRVLPDEDDHAIEPWYKAGGTTLSTKRMLVKPAQQDTQPAALVPALPDHRFPDGTDPAAQPRAQ
jgi:hypothetical protein